MANKSIVNNRILEKLDEKTQGQPEMAELLLRLLCFEIEEPGWYMKRYKQELEETVKEGQA